MQTMQPEQAAFLLQTALPGIKREHDITAKIIEAIPSDQGHFSPDSISKPALDLLTT